MCSALAWRGFEPVKDRQGVLRSSFTLIEVALCAGALLGLLHIAWRLLVVLSVVRKWPVRLTIGVLGTATAIIAGVVPTWQATLAARLAASGLLLVFVVGALAGTVREEADLRRLARMLRLGPLPAGPPTKESRES